MRTGRLPSGRFVIGGGRVERVPLGTALAAALVLAALLAGGCRRSEVQRSPAPTPTPTVTGATRAERLGQVRTWSFAIGVDLAGGTAADAAARFDGFDLVVLDGLAVSAEVVAALQAQGTIVLAYVNVGAIEQGRPWTAAASPYRLDHWAQWDEWYADVTEPGFRSLVTTTMVPPMLASGVDGLFLDNVDMVDTHPAQREAMVGLVAELSAMVHERDRYLFAQNGEEETIDALLPYLDGWNREDVSFTYDADAQRYVAVPRTERAAALAALRRVHGRGVFVTSTDYVPDPNAAVQDAVREACGVGAVPTFGDIGLSRTYPPQRC